jgi:metacaspase-1
MRTAVLVGINEYAHRELVPSLPGCRNEAGIDVDPRRVLEDGAATKRAVLDALAGAVDSLRAGDELIVHYSGHGAPLPWRNAVHDALCPYDFDWSRECAILKADLDELLTALPSGTRVIVVADTCFSGGFRLPYDALLELAIAPPHRIRTVPVPPDVATDIAAFRGAGDTAFAQISSVRDIVILTACGRTRTAADAVFENRANGVLTYHLVRAVRRVALPARELAHALVAALQPFGQTPELHGRDSLLAVPFL